MILRNHGLLVCGRHACEAFLNIYYLERACQAQIAAQSGGAELVLPPESVRLHTAAQFNRPSDGTHFAMAWASALRLIEDGKPDYRS
jgi:ribulose-5-phosphate 4-epimerase/fuculose-1-phosphate aldolase